MLTHVQLFGLNGLSVSVTNLAIVSIKGLDLPYQ